MIVFFTYLLTLLWVVFVIFLIKYKRLISINVFGLTLLSASLQSFFLFYKLDFTMFEVEQNIEVLIVRYLVLITYAAVLHDKYKLYKHLLKLNK